ncbi:MAG: YraN family protein [Methylocystaceae bacterium]
MMNQRQHLGKQGEEIAVRYLKSQGYQVLRERYRVAQGEIDIIATWGQTLVFIEVKTRTSTAYGLPAEAVTYQKQGKIRQVAMAFLQEGNHKYNNFRFDVISILMQGREKYQLDHIEGAF